MKFLAKPKKDILNLYFNESEIIKSSRKNLIFDKIILSRINIVKIINIEFYEHPLKINS